MTLKFKLKSGQIIEPLKDCGCIDHSGPHWLHANNLWKERNNGLMKIAMDVNQDTSRKWYATAGLAMEEDARLKEKEYAMRCGGITEIIEEEDFMESVTPAH